MICIRIDNTIAGTLQDRGIGCINGDFCSRKHLNKYSNIDLALMKCSEPVKLGVYIFELETFALEYLIQQTYFTDYNYS